jgi:hypothetical protein
MLTADFTCEEIEEEVKKDGGICSGKGEGDRLRAARGE